MGTSEAQGEERWLKKSWSTPSDAMRAVSFSLRAKEAKGAIDEE